MQVDPVVFPDPGAVGAAAAAIVLDRLAENPPGRPFLLGCPGGRSPMTTYVALARRARAANIDLSRLVIVMMDEYVVADRSGLLVSEDPAALHSCRRFGRVDILGQLNVGRSAAHRIPDDQLWLPDPATPDEYDRRLADNGGIDLFLLACGASDGHIAFNPPGSAEDSRTRVVRLSDSTRRDNLATFPSFGNRLEAVPEHGVTVGIGTIRDLSREVVMIVHGAAKRTAATRLADAHRYDPDWPATIVADCRRPHLMFDTAATSAGIPA